MTKALERARLTSVSVVILLAWILAPAVVSASPIQYHRSTENFFDSGGTSVTGCVGAGCPSMNFEFGDTSGNVTWQVQEKANFDSMKNEVTISYTVFNDTLSDNITSFHVKIGLTPDSVSAPAGWTAMVMGDEVWWQTDDENNGIPTNQSLDTMVLTFNRDTKVGIRFAQVKRDFLDAYNVRQTVTSTDWRASSPIPEPGSLLLLGSGLAGFAYLRRRRRAKASPR